MKIRNGVVECWSDGVMQGDSTIMHSITPLLHYSITPMLG